MEAFFRPFVEFIIAYSYAAEFIVLLACGLGLPVPEEVTIISGGYLCYKHGNQIWITTVVCMTAILLGDWLMFLLGRRYGKWILRSKWFHRLLTRRKLARVTLYFRKYGDKTVFFARFFAGIRVPVYFMAGTMKMRSWKFLWIDFLGAFLSVPISVWAGWYFGENIEQAVQVMKRWKTGIALGILACVAIYAAWRWYVSYRNERRGVKVYLQARPLPQQAPVPREDA